MYVYHDNLMLISLTLCDLMMGYLYFFTGVLQIEKMLINTTLFYV